MTYIIQITFLCCLGVFEGMCHPIASAKWKAEDMSSLLRQYYLRRLRDELYELPPTMYFQDFFKKREDLPPTMYFQDTERGDLPPTLYLGDEPEDRIKIPPSLHTGWDDYARRGEIEKDGLLPLPPILAGWKEDALEAPPKVHSGWRAGDPGSQRVHSGSRAGDAILTDLRQDRPRSKLWGWRAGDTDQDLRQDRPRSKLWGWRAGDTDQVPFRK